jgi:peptidoglycan/LPS O-acetylase OafA/YrhL
MTARVHPPLLAVAELARPVGVRHSSAYLPELEALRGLAIILVFAHHATAMIEPHQFLGDVRVSLPWAFINVGSTGVSLFFVLSGFLLSLPFLAEAAGGKPVIRRDYFARRALRILPLYYTAVLVATVATVQQVGDALYSVRYLAFLTWFARNPLWPFSGVWWSLTTEVHFYLLLPLLPFALRSALGRAAAAGGLVLYALTYAAFQSLVELDLLTHLIVSHSLLCLAPQFAAGIFAAWVYQRHGARIGEIARQRRWLRRGTSDLVLLALFAALGWLLQWVVFYGIWPSEFGLIQTWHILEGVLWAAIVLVLLVLPLRGKAIISNRTLRALGVWSYSIYLWHFPLLWFATHRLRQRWALPLNEWNASTVAVMAGLTLACVAISVLTYRFIERPFLTRKARLDR